MGTRGFIRALRYITESGLSGDPSAKDILRDRDETEYSQLARKHGPWSPKPKSEDEKASSDRFKYLKSRMRDYARDRINAAKHKVELKKKRDADDKLMKSREGLQARIRHLDPSHPISQQTLWKVPQFDKDWTNRLSKKAGGKAIFHPHEAGKVSKKHWKDMHKTPTASTPDPRAKVNPLQKRINRLKNG